METRYSIHYNNASNPILPSDSSLDEARPEMMTIEATLGQVSAGESLSMEAAAAAIGSIMDGKWSDEQIGLFLMALRTKGEAVEEIAGAALAMRRHMIPIRSSREGLIDTCGTGGSGSSTFNISTSAALVTAAAGVPVAKHGNRKITSRSGSADVLSALGVNIEAPVSLGREMSRQVGHLFLFRAAVASGDETGRRCAS